MIMKNMILTVIFLLCLNLVTNAQNKQYKIVTSDIDNFWAAYDSLEFAKSTQDSIRIIQDNYIGNASRELLEFFKVRPSYTAERYVKVISLFPKFWKSLRPRTRLIKGLIPEISKIYSIYSQQLPNFQPPNVCFAIGAMSSGGTTTQNLVLIGTEIDAADSMTNTSEISGWLKQKVGKGNLQYKIPAIVAHEIVHTQQKKPRRRTLLWKAIQEGSADFIPKLLLGYQNNLRVFKYGKEHECELWKLFKQDLNDVKTINTWFYSTVNNRPADMGYFIGSEVCKAYYDNMKNKKEALKTILKTTNYKAVLKRSRYMGQCSY